MTKLRIQGAWRRLSLLYAAALLCLAGCPGTPSSGSRTPALSSRDVDVSPPAGGEVELAQVATAAPTDSWEAAVRRVRWVTYFPSTGDPNQGVDAKPEDVLADLLLLRRAGFGGLITYTTKGVQGTTLTKIAEACGYDGLILGVWNCKSQEELVAARNCASSSIVLGISVGNEGWKKRYTHAELVDAIDGLRAATGKKVTTTEEIDDYADPELTGIGDWIFPNAHPYFHSRIEPERAVRWTENVYNDLQRRAGQKLVWFKEVGLPTAGGEGLSEKRQLEYYQALAKTSVLYATFESFSLPWKNHLPIEPHWGVFETDRRPKLMGQHLLKQYSHVDVPEVSLQLALRGKEGVGGNEAGKSPMIIGAKFSVDQSYIPSGVIGDLGDIEFTFPESGVVRFVYTPRGKGPHEWDHKYLKGKLNEKPSRQAGAAWLSPANNWGESPGGGYDLREFGPNLVAWEARSLEGPLNVRFFSGGVAWKWSPKGEQVKVPYPDTVPWTQLGTKTLGPEWQTFQGGLDGRSLDFTRLVCGFGWLATWDDNVPRDGKVAPRHVLEIRNVRYEQAASQPTSDKVFYVYDDADSSHNHFTPSGRMGDCGDVRIEEVCTVKPYSGKTCMKVTYTAKGTGPHSCEYPPPCKWAGCYWQNPPNNWGEKEYWKNKGYNLSVYRQLVFYARAERNCNLTFLVGGIEAPFGDSAPAAARQFVSLTTEWKKFTVPLAGYDLKHIIGGFGFVTNWDENREGTTFYLDEVKFEK